MNTGISQKLFLLLPILVLLTWNTSTAQHFMRGVCGVHAHDMEEMEKLYPNDEKGLALGDRNAIVHVPVQFHLVANDAGSGRIPPPFVLKQLCKLNSDYANTNFRFYLYDNFKNINNTKIYSTPATNGNAIQSMKVSKALNVFITDKADTEGSLGTTLGYYSPQGDYIVLIKSEAVKQSNTLSHEVGHFFSLRHTFHGWESDPWDITRHNDTIQVRYTISNGEIEFVSRTNCVTAADQLCDTPPDYNFGLTSNNCNYTYDVWDFNHEKVIPQKENQMSYFNNCGQYIFTPNQVTRMQNNYNSATRNYLKNQPAPNTDTIVGPVTIIQPTQGQQLTVYDGVLFDWEDVPNATHYILEIRNLSSNEYLIVDKSEYYATNLRKNFQYTYEVTPFSFGQFCAASQSVTFKTGNSSITSTEESNLNANNTVYPNPVALGTPVVLQFGNDIAGDIQYNVYDFQGKLIVSENKSIESGKNHLLVNTNGWKAGLHIVQMKTQTSVNTVKVQVY